MRTGGGRFAALLAAYALVFGCTSDDEALPGNVEAVDPGKAGVAVVGDRRVPFTPAGDVAFIDYFIAHHTMAISMAAHVIERGGDAEVRTMAQAMIDAQSAEITQMESARRELTGFEDAPHPPNDPHMMAEIAEMGTMSGLALDQMFLANMIAHHASALEPAKRGRLTVQRDDMRALADRIFDDQAKEIGEMSAMLERMPPENAIGGDTTLEGDRRVPVTPGNDVLFIDFFVDHHMHATAMAQLVIDKGAREDVKVIARTIIDEQTRELAQMRAARLELTGSDVVPAGPEDPIRRRDMQAMTSAPAESVDRMFLEAMIAHHASGLAPALRARGFLQREDLRALAESMFASQSRQIGEMEERIGE